MDKKQTQIYENEEVIPPKVRVGLAEKEKHSVFVQNALKHFPFLLYYYIRTLVTFYPIFFRNVFLLSMNICGIMFVSRMKILTNSTLLIYMEDRKALISM